MATIQGQRRNRLNSYLLGGLEATMKLKLNDKFVIPNGAGKLTVEIIGLGVDTKFTVSGYGVQKPEQPREMPTLAFAKWLKQTMAVKSA